MATEGRTKVEAFRVRVMCEVEQPDSGLVCGGELEFTGTAARSVATGSGSRTSTVMIRIDYHRAGDKLAELCGYQMSGTFRTYLGQMRTLGLIPKRGDIRATELVFPEGVV